MIIIIIIYMLLCLYAYMLLKSKCIKTDFYYKCPRVVYGIIPLPFLLSKLYYF